MSRIRIDWRGRRGFICARQKPVVFIRPLPTAPIKGSFVEERFYEKRPQP
jgi:hypothetical protein